MASRTKKDARDSETLKNIGLELEAPQDEYSYPPGSGSTASDDLENPSMPIPGESSWSQQHRFPYEGVAQVTKLSDDDLQELVEERLDYHPQLGGLRIEVIVSHGAVSLRGRV